MDNTLNSLGRHVAAELYGCNAALIDEVSLVEQIMLEAAQAARATVVNATFHHFSPFGVSGVVVIAESHLAIHTWPEYGFAALDVFTCGQQVDPWGVVAFIKTAFQSDKDETWELKRGQAATIQKSGYQLKADVAYQRQRYFNETWFTERIHDVAFSVRYEGNLLFKGKSAYQTIEVYDTQAFGRMLVLDGVITFSEKDEFIFHEMAVHVPMAYQQAPQKILVLGGGDGGMVRELLRYPSVEEIVVLERDPLVMEVAQRYLPSVAATLSDARVKVIGQDVETALNQWPANTFDGVVADMADVYAWQPPASLLLQIRAMVKEQGFFVTPIGQPSLDPGQFSRFYQQLVTCYGPEATHVFLAYMPTLPTGTWGFACCGKQSFDPNLTVMPNQADTEMFGNPLQYYNHAVHKAAFAIPNFITQLLKSR